jgi:HemY protein
MIRLVIFLVILTAIAFGAGWLADRPGTVVIHWQGWDMETSVLFAAVALVALVVAAGVLWSILSTLFNLPTLMSSSLSSRRRSRGFQALSRGIVAAGAGDAKTARRAASEAERLLGHEPLTLLLRAQAAQLSGDQAAAESAFHEMAANKQTRLLGLRGLWMEAQRREDLKAARGYAETAASEAPGLPWAAQAALDTRAAAGDWAGALALLERNNRAGVTDRASVKRLRAVLLTADAMAQQTGEPEGAREKALEAVKLEPTLVPAAVMAGKLLGKVGELRRASKILETAWRETPHPEIAEVYVHLRDADGTRDRLERAKTLQRLAPSGHPEGALTVVRAALNAQDFATARAAMVHLTYEPTQRVCLLMAELEAAEHGDVGKAREWAARAVRAKRDPAWVADGFVSDRWLPISPITGRIDAFEWKVPPIELGGPVLEHEVEAAMTVVEAAANARMPEAEAVLTPVAAAAPPQAAEPIVINAEPAAPTVIEAEPVKIEPEPDYTADQRQRA